MTPDKLISDEEIKELEIAYEGSPSKRFKLERYGSLYIQPEEPLPLDNGENSARNSIFLVTAANSIGPLLERLRSAEDALKFYAEKENWERIVGHTDWASNLKILDCAFFNAGGGRARAHFSKISAGEK